MRAVSVFALFTELLRAGFGKSQPCERPQQSSSAINSRQIGSLRFIEGRVPGNMAEGSASIVVIT